MADKTGIEWTDATYNPITGCTKVSPGCDNCYAERVTKRFKHNGGNFDEVVIHNDRFDQPMRWTKPRMIFVNSMGDTFHSDVPDIVIDTLFVTMAVTKRHTYQVLTKRPNRVRRWWDGFQERLGSDDHLTQMCEINPHITDYRYSWTLESMRTWPEHIWLGTSVESNEYLPRIDRIAGIAPITFLSAEPLLESLVDIGDYLDKLNWVIVGGESGREHRPIESDWVRQIRNDCLMYDTPFFFKQWGGLSPKSNGRELDGREWSEMPVMAGDTEQ